MRLVLACLVALVLSGTTPFAAQKGHFFYRPKPLCPKPTTTTTSPAAAPRWEVVDAAGATVGLAATYGQNGVATVLLEVGTEVVPVNITATGWSAEGGGPLLYLAPDCVGEPFAPQRPQQSLTAQAFGKYSPEEGLNDTNLYAVDQSATPQDLVVYSVRAQTSDDACINTGATAPTPLSPVRVYSPVMAGFRLPFKVRAVR